MRRAVPSCLPRERTIGPGCNGGKGRWSVVRNNAQSCNNPAYNAFPASPGGSRASTFPASGFDPGRAPEQWGRSQGSGTKRAGPSGDSSRTGGFVVQFRQRQGLKNWLSVRLSVFTYQNVQGANKHGVFGAGGRPIWLSPWLSVVTRSGGRTA